MQRSYLRTMRHNRNLTLLEVAQQIGISRQVLGNIEKGRRDPSLKVACKLEKFFGIPVCILLRRDGEED